MVNNVTETAIVGGVDTHKDLLVAAVVDQNNKVLGTRYFATTRQGYRQMLAWMTSFGALKRIGVESAPSGLLRYLQSAWLEVLEVTAPDRMERRKREKVTRLMLNVLLMPHSPESEQSHPKLAMA